MTGVTLERSAVLCAVFGCLALLGCGADPQGEPAGADLGSAAVRPAANEPWFAQEAAARGLDFVQHSGATGELFMPEIMSGGAALFDGDDDGDLDAYLVQAGAVRGPASERDPNLLLRNDGGHFTDVTEGSGAGDRGYGNGVACGDADGDGRVDLYVTNLGPNTLLFNRGELRFETRDDGGAADPGWGTSAAFFDADRDGDLDLFVCNYLAWRPENELPCVNPRGAPDYCSPASYESPARDTFLRNAGQGRFVDETELVGMGAVGTGLGVAILDVDADGWLDVFVANDAMPDRLWRSEAGARFRDDAAELGIAVDSDGLAKAGMGVAVADLDDDGREDLLVGNLARESDSIYMLRGERFADSTRRVGMGASSKPFTRFGLGFCDFDHDGWLDLFQANGRVQRAPGRSPADDPYAEPNQLFRGSAQGRFERVEPLGGTEPVLVATARAAAFGDVDGDGGVDVLVVNRDGPAHLLRNLCAERGGWIGFDLRESSGAPSLHAQVVVTVETPAGERRIHRTARAASSYQSSSDPRIHVGLGAGRLVSVEVHWPDGETAQLDAFEAGRWHRVRRDG
ncbi:CRTAC1 family protein [Engelhardtia mirabilis]|uniref:ASPIC and UnbV n=1 Tax=Engelhardtia mirabilis TaxID=2528011 RepID=A0A518BN25_9BACT|nr:ASPIC and UnbV [Planctomycetes bacterium Pla133]QDV02704.1 ASPIC and UnbV [Planctomycetes bacterium Pla86]